MSSCAKMPTGNTDHINLSKVLALGKLIEANAKTATHEVDLIVRLYEMPIFENDCFIETHGICQNQYYVAVSTYDEYPETNVFKLNHRGVLVDFHWVEDSQTDYVKLMLVMNKYTTEALENNKNLVNVQSNISVELTPNTISQIIEK